MAIPKGGSRAGVRHIPDLQSRDNVGGADEYDTGCSKYV